MKNKTFPLMGAIIFFCFFSQNHEAGQKSLWKGKKEKIDGVDIIRNPKTPLYGPEIFRLEEELVIGKNAFTNIWCLAVDDEERIYAMDEGDACVKVFDRKGLRIKTIGRKGEGPGEVQAPNNVFIAGDRKLYFEDYISRINVYDSDGRFVEAIPMSEIMPIDVLVTPQEKIFVRANSKTAGKNGKEIRLYDRRLNLIKTCFFIPEAPTVEDVARPFAAGFSWALGRDDALFVSHQANYQLDVFNSSGERIRRILREYVPVAIGKEEIEKFKVRRPDKKPEIPDHHPAVQSLTADDEGRIFVGVKERTKDEETSSYDVFDSEGRFIAKILLSRRQRPMVWKKGKMFAIEEDEDGFQLVKKYKVFWNIKNMP